MIVSKAMQVFTCKALNKRLGMLGYENVSQPLHAML